MLATNENTDRTAERRSRWRTVAFSRLLRDAKTQQERRELGVAQVHPSVSGLGISQVPAGMKTGFIYRRNFGAFGGGQPTDAYRVVHIPSGYELLGYSCTKQIAREIVLALAGVADWSIEIEQLRATLDVAKVSKVAKHVLGILE